MKKTAISLLLALALVLSIVLVAVPAVQAMEAHSHCVCNGNTPIAAANHECATVTYEEWNVDPATNDKVTVETDEETGDITNYTLSGTYYLTEDFTTTANIWVDGELTICLNGHTLTCARIRFNYGTDSANSTHVINICDCSEGKTGALIGTTAQMFYNTSSSTTDPTAYPATINIWGGNISDTATGGRIGHVFTLGATKTEKNVLNIYGGTITGGTMTSTSSGSAQGGVMRISNGTVCNIYGGTIQGGKVASGDSKSAQGGNIYMMTSTSALNIYGGTIKNGVAEKVGTKVGMGGNIYAAGGTVTIKGGTIEGGTSSSAYGGNIYAVSAVTLNFDGGTIISAASGSTIVHNTKKITVGTIDKMAIEINGDDVSVGVGYTANVTVTEFDLADIEVGVKLRKATSTSYLYDGKTATEAGIESGTEKTIKGRITGMMKENDTSNAATGVCGAAYVKIGSTVVESQESAAYSAQSIIEAMDAQSFALSILADLYKVEAYTDVMGGWNIPNIKAKAAA